MLEGPGEDSSMRASLLANDGANEEEDEAQEEERGGMSTPGKYAVVSEEDPLPCDDRMHAAYSADSERYSIVSHSSGLC